MRQRVEKVITVLMLVMTLMVIVACSKTRNESTKQVDNSNIHTEVTMDEESKNDDSIKNAVNEKTDDKDSELEKKETVDTIEDNKNENQEKNESSGEGQSTKEVIDESLLVEGGIKSIYEPFGMKAGTCISDYVVSQSKFSAHILENYNSVTMENDMKPDYILNKDKSIIADDIVVEFSTKVIKMLEWAKINNLAVRGHTIVWHSQTPQWIFHENFDTSKAMVDRDTMLKRMESYIKQVFELLNTLGYLDIFYAYDVVNEAIMEDGSYRDSNWKQIIGEDYIWYAFYYADKYAPESIKLYYNDYNEQFKTEHIVKLTKSLVDKNGRSLIDGIGCQAHLYTRDSIDSYMKTLETFSNLGLDVQITEIDVSLGEWNEILPPTNENLQAQGQWYYELVQRIANGNKDGTTCVSGITFWGISDNISWRKDRNPLLFDSALNPKYAYYGAVLMEEQAGFK